MAAGCLAAARAAGWLAGSCLGSWLAAVWAVIWAAGWDLRQHGQWRVTSWVWGLHATNNQDAGTWKQQPGSSMQEATERLERPRLQEEPVRLERIDAAIVTLLLSLYVEVFWSDRNQ